MTKESSLQNIRMSVFFSASCLACGISVPQPDIEPEPPALEMPSPNLWTIRKVPGCLCSYSTFLVLIISCLVSHLHMWCCCLVAKSCPTLCTPMDCSPPGSTVHGILQARLPEWVVISSSRASSQPRDQTHIFCIGRWILFLPLSNLEAPLYIVLVPNDLCSFTTTHGILWHYHRICPDVHGSVLLQGRLKCVCVGLP